MGNKTPKDHDNEPPILGILKESDQGKSLPDVLRVHGISSGTSYRWNKPARNGYSGKLRDECLNAHESINLPHARELLDALPG